MKPETPTKIELIDAVAVLVAAMRRIAGMCSFSADREDILDIANEALAEVVRS